MGIAEDKARGLLAHLADSSILFEGLEGRYAFHDLMRAYAEELTQDVESKSETRAAKSRLLDHYLRVAYQAALLLAPYRDAIQLTPPVSGTLTEEITDHHQALAWFRSEYLTLRALIQHNAGYFDDQVWRLA